VQTAGSWGWLRWRNFRGWIHRHANIVLSFAVGLTFGIAILALAYFSTRNEVAAGALRFGAKITGNTDIDEDLVWFFCGSLSRRGHLPRLVAGQQGASDRSGEGRRSEPSNHGSKASGCSKAEMIPGVTLPSDRCQMY